MRRSFHIADFVRGSLTAGVPSTAFSRLPNPADARLPRDIVDAAVIPAGLRLELVGDAQRIRIRYRARAPHPMHPPTMADCFAAWSANSAAVRVPVRAAPVAEASVEVVLPQRDQSEPVLIYLPERLLPEIVDLEACDGSIEPAARRPRWLVYGDSITQGWSVSEPAAAWPAVVARGLRLDVCNLGFAGAARGEAAVAEQISQCRADLITLAFGTNCWTKVPASAAGLRETVATFIDILRDGNPAAPILVITPIVRPSAESTPNRLGADLRSLRNAVADAVRSRQSVGDHLLELTDAASMVSPADLTDGIHPGDEGHLALAKAATTALTRLLPSRRSRAV